MVTRAADYALRATLTLTALPPGARLCLSELADECEVPPAFLYKVLSSLARSGLLASHRGVTGGYELTARARDSSVLDVVEAVDGLPLLNTCVLSGTCHRAQACPGHPVWIQAQERVREVLAGARLADLARLQPGAPRRAGRHARPGRACATMPERPRVGRGIRTPVPGGRRSGGTHPKRMGNR
jgi:Rrf2 family transcriptional regulator, nitric oxide-sensitive transcriptional repressor